MFKILAYYQKGAVKVLISANLYQSFYQSNLLLKIIKKRISSKTHSYCKDVNKIVTKSYPFKQ